MRRSAAHLLACALLPFLFLSPVAQAAQSNIWSLGNPLVDAVDRGDQAEVISLLKEGNTADSHGDFGVTPLMRAAYRGNAELAQILIKAGANIDAADIGGATPLHLAARNGHEEVIKILLQSGATIDAPDAEQWTPLMRAAMSGHKKAVSVLLAKGADITRKNDAGQTVLSSAASGGSAAIVKMIMADPSFNKITENERSKALAFARSKHNNAVENVLAGNEAETEKNVADTNAAATSETSESANKKETAETHAADTKLASSEEASSERTNKKDAPAKQFSLLDLFRTSVSGDTKTSENSSKPKAVEKEKPALVAEQPVIQSEPLKPIAREKASSVAQNVEDKPSPKNSVVASITPAPESSTSRNDFRSEKLPPVIRPEKEWKSSVHADTQTAPALSQSKPLPTSATRASASSSNMRGTKKRYLLQLGAFENPGEAEEKWLSMKNDVKELKMLQPDIVQAALGMERSVVYRLRASGFDTKKIAEQRCNTLRGKDIECFVVESALMESAPVQTQEANASAPSEYRSIPKELAENARVSVPEKEPVKETMTVAEARNYPSLVPPTLRDIPSSQIVKGLPWKESQPQPSSPPQMLARAENDPNPLSLLPRSSEAQSASMSSTNGIPTYSSPAQGVTEAVRLPDDMHFAPGQAVPITPRPIQVSTQAPAQTLPGTWLAIGDFPNEQAAADYWLRMFKYNESFNYLHMVMSAPMVANSGGVGMNVGPIQPSDAWSVCRIVNSGGYGCYVKGDTNSAALSPPQNTTTYQTATAPMPAQTMIAPNASVPMDQAPPAFNAMASAPNPSWIHLGNFRGEGEAEYYWMVMQQDHADMFGGMQHFIDDPGPSDPSMRARLKLGPFANNRMAEQLCGDMRKARVPCMVVN